MGFILSFISGISTLLGFFIIYIRGDKNKIISSSLFFASSIMIFVSIFDLIPSSFKYISNYYFIIFSLLLLSIFIIIGILISYFLDRFIPNSDNIYHLGILTMLVIIIHNIPEGIITYITSSRDLRLGIKISLAILFHNIPEGISVSLLTYMSSKSKKKAFLYTLISGLSEIFGAFLAFLFLSRFITDYILGFIFSIIAGMMLHIAITGLLPSALKYKYKYGFIWFLLGILVMFISIAVID